MSNYKLAAAAYPIAYHASPEAWQAYSETWAAEAARQGARLLLLPEYGSMELVSLLPQALQADLQGQLQAMQAFVPRFQETYAGLAKRHNLIIVAPSFPLNLGTHFVNRAWVFSPTKGLAGYQDKLFMTRFETESWGISPGEPVLSLFEDGDCRFGIQICYDSEFALGAWQLAQAGAQLILAPSCTETPRGAHRVHIGCRARALENQSYVLVAQTIGEAEWSPAVDLNYGYAACYASPDRGMPPDGVLGQTEPQKPGQLVLELSWSKLQRLRQEGQVLNFRDHQALNYAFKGQKLQIKTCIL